MILQTLYEFVIAILIGVTQGITEFLPVSSTAHMRIVAGLLADNRDIGSATGNFIQLGTVLAMVYYFRADLADFYRRTMVLLRSHNQRIAFFKTVNDWIRGNYTNISETDHTHYVDITMAQLAIATIPIAFLGFLLRDFVDTIRSFYVIAGLLLFGSGLMALAEYTHKLVWDARKISSKFYTLPEVVLIGLFQSLAIFPGISRSGATLSGTLMLGHKREGAVRFSFLLSLPALILAGLLSLYELNKEFLDGAVHILPGQGLFMDERIQLSVVSLIIAFFISMVTGYISLKWLLKYLSSHTFKPFIIYRLILVVFLVSIMLLGFGS